MNVNYNTDVVLCQIKNSSVNGNTRLILDLWVRKGLQNRRSHLYSQAEMNCIKNPCLWRLIKVYIYFYCICNVHNLIQFKTNDFDRTSSKLNFSVFHINLAYVCIFLNQQIPFFAKLFYIVSCIFDFFKLSLLHNFLPILCLISFISLSSSVYMIKPY